MEDVNNNDASDHRKRDEAGSSSEPPADPYEPLPLETDPTLTTSTSNSTPKHDANCLTRGYVSPSDIIPLPKAPERKIKGGKRKKGSTRILTDTPVRNAIAVADELKRLKKSRSKKMKGANKSLNFNENRKKAKGIKPKKRKLVESDTSLSEFEMDFDEPTSEVELDEHHDEDDIIEGDYVIVRVDGRRDTIST